MFLEKIKVTQDATRLLVALLLAHLLVLSFNRTPSQPERRLGQVVLLSLYAPVQFVAAHGWGSFRAGWQRYISLRDARQENEQLRTQVAQLNQRLFETEDQARVAQQFTELQTWRTSQSYPVIPARVIARDAIQWFNTVVIDRGSLQGVQKDMPVITPGGLVGRVVVAGPISARVLLLTDERHGGGAIIGTAVNSRLLGAVRGKNTQLLTMKLIEAADKVTPGEAVITSGQDGIYPRGLLIGRVRVTPGSPGVSPTLEVEPAVTVSTLDVVAVLQVPRDQVRVKVEQLTELEASKQAAEQTKTGNRGR